MPGSASGGGASTRRRARHCVPPAHPAPCAALGWQTLKAASGTWSLPKCMLVPLPLPCKCSDGHRGTGEEELRIFCRGRIAHYKVPRYFKFVSSFPMTTSGKPQVGAASCMQRCFKALL